MECGNTVDAAQEFLQLHNELRLAKRALFHRELAYRDQPLGSVYPPQENTFWQKECGEYEARSCETYSQELDNDDYDIDQSDFSFAWRDKTRQRHYPTPTNENLLYAGKWCKLYNQAQSHKQYLNYMKAIKKLNGTRFEKLLKGDGTYQQISAGYRHMMIYLKEKKVKVRPYEGFPFTEELPEKRELELSVFRLVAGALIVYSAAHDYIDAEPVIPHEDIKKAAQAALSKINSHNFEVRGDFREQLEAMALGINPNRNAYPVIKDSSRRKLFVREVSLLSKKLLNTASPKKSRFPTAALKAALSIIEERPPTQRTLGGYQSMYDEVKEDNPNEQPHTDNHSAWLREIWLCDE